MNGNFKNGLPLPILDSNNNNRRIAQNANGGSYGNIIGDNYMDYKRMLEREKMNMTNHSVNNTNINTNILPSQQQRKNSTSQVLSRGGPIGGDILDPGNRNYTQGISREAQRGNDIIDPGSHDYAFARTNHPPTPNRHQVPHLPEQNDYIMSELKNTKMLIKTALENQNEMQSKIIEYNRIFSEQENIIRLNNIKLNEHDSKLTEILFTFNNYLLLNDKTTNIINDLSTKVQDCVKVSDFTELKSTVYNFNKNNESKILEAFHQNEDLNMKMTEYINETENFQKYTMEKLKAYQREAMETRLQQQQELIKLEESKESKLNAQFDQLKGLIKYLENSINGEATYRKNMIENLRGEVFNTFTRNDEKFAKLEKSQLETEKNLIYLNKDYMSVFQELIMKHNQKYDIEFKSLRSIIEAGITKLDIKIEEMNKSYENSLFDVRKSIQETKTVMSELEIHVKDSLEIMEKKVDEFVEDEGGLKNKIEVMSGTLDNFMKENLILINSRYSELSTTFESKLRTQSHELSSIIEVLEERTKKTFDDVHEKIKGIFKQLSDYIIKHDEGDFGKKISKNEEINSTDVELALLEKKVEDKIIKVKSEFEEFEKKMILMMNLHIDGVKTKFNEDNRLLLTEISEKLDMKMEVFKKDFEKIKKEDDLIREGRIQEYVIESENRIKQNLDGRLTKVQEDVENIVVKLGVSGN